MIIEEVSLLVEGDELPLVLELGQGPHSVVRPLPSLPQLESLWVEQW